ncbi:MAG: hypothetical protein JNK02_01365 [Planctomycetes bacterium]|nr:hypothetical protein [Planctomycetota bacterium]
MVPPLHRLAPLLVVAAVLGAPTAGAQGPAARPEERFGPLSVPPPPAEWRGLVERDRTVQFTGRTATLARAALATPGLSAERRAAAIVALGCASDEGERAFLESAARTSTGVERAAAILALGEMNAGATALLLDIAAAEQGLVRESALLALLRDGRNAGRRRVEEIAADPAHPAASAARELLVHVFDPGASSPTPAGTLLVRLRFEAAREYGLVAGQAWRVLAIRELASDPERLAEIVVGAQSEVRRVGVADHLLQVLFAGRGAARLRAAVAVMPRELSELVANELWMPADPDEWRVLLEEVRDRRVERLVPELVRAALDVPGLRWRAVELLGQAGEDADAALRGADPSALDVAARAEFAQALGGVRDAAWLARHGALAEDPEPLVRAAYRVAGLRHDQRKAEAEVEERVRERGHPEHRATVEALQRAARDPRAADLLEELLARTQGRERVAIATALTRAGRLVGRPVVREALSADPAPRGALAVELVRALAAGGIAEDLELYRALFPRPDDRELDVELARTLASAGDRAVESLLRTALWESDFEVSLLAAGLLYDTGGGFPLLRELANPPVGAASTDLRRVGFAAGLWGGLSEYQRVLRELRGTGAHPAVQGAWLGALASRTR